MEESPVSLFQREGDVDLRNIYSLKVESYVLLCGNF